MGSQWAFVKDEVSGLVQPRIELFCFPETKFPHYSQSKPHTNYPDPEPYGKQFSFMTWLQKFYSTLLTLLIYHEIETVRCQP